MKIAFCTVPPLSNGNKIEAEDCCWQSNTTSVLPAMLLACASEAQRAGHTVAFIDLTIDGPLVIRDFQPDLVVFPLAWPWHLSSWQVMVPALRHTDAPWLVLSIPPGYAANYAKLVPAPFAVAYSEPEAVCASLPQDAHDLHLWRLEATLGLVWRSDDGLLHDSGRRPSGLHELGSVDWSLVPDKYWSRYAAGSVVYQVTRGCPYHCRFCVWGASTVTDQRFRMRPAEQVVADLAQLKATATWHGDKLPALYLLSAQLTTRLSWVEQFAAATTDPYPFMSNCNLLEVSHNPPVIDLLLGAGMTAWTCGVEALSDQTLKLLGKPFTWAEALAGMILLQNSKVPILKTHILMGYGETDADVDEAITNLKIMYESGVRRFSINMHPVVYYRGTEMGDHPPGPVRQIRSAHYKDVAYCLVLDKQLSAWPRFAAELARNGYLSRRSFKGCEPEFLEGYSLCRDHS